MSKIRTVIEYDSTNYAIGRAIVAMKGISSIKTTTVRGPRSKGPWYVQYKGQKINAYSDYMSPSQYRKRRDAFWAIKAMIRDSVFNKKSAKPSDYKIVN